MSTTSSLVDRHPADGLTASVAVVALSAITEYDTASPPSAQLRPAAIFVVLRLIVPDATDVAPSVPVPPGVAAFVSHVVPEYPGPQWQANEFTPAVQVPPLRHELVVHLSITVHPVDPVPV
jgi:hypothetical protein